MKTDFGFISTFPVSRFSTTYSVAAGKCDVLLLIHIETRVRRAPRREGKGLRDATDQLGRWDKKLEKRREPQNEYAVTSARNMKSYNVAADRSHV